MLGKTAVVIGATGLTGTFLVQLLLNNEDFSTVRVLVRRPLQIIHPKLQVQVIDFEDVRKFKEGIGSGDCIFCCIGTTQSKVKGDIGAYRKVDIDIPFAAAKMGKVAGFKSFLLVSAVGANAKASNFYLRIKGELEQKIASLEYKQFHIFRPSLVLGQRNEFRLKETIAKNIMRFINPFLFGRAKRYHSMLAKDIAAAMVAAAKQSAQGMFIHYYPGMMRLVNPGS